MEVHKGTIHSIERDIFEKKIITASSDGIIRVFENTSEPDDVVHLKLECELESNLGASTKAIFVHYGEFLASAYSTGMLVIWKKEGNSFTKKSELKVFSGSINDISSTFKNNLIQIYCACSDGNIRIINFNESLEGSIKEVMAHRFGISTIDSNDNFIVSGGLDYSTAVWQNDQEVVRFRDHKALVRDVCIAPENVFDIFCFASCGEDCKIYIYWKHDSEFMKQEIVLDEPVYSLSWSKSGFTLSVGYGNNKFKCYEPGKEGQYIETELTSEK